MYSAKAFSPAGLSGFFAAYPVKDDPLRSGAKGGGLALARGVKVEVSVEEAKKTEIITLLNGELRDMYVARRAIEILLQKAEYDMRIVIDQEIQIPVGGGLGSSAASALAAALAFAKAARLKVTYNEAARAAHIADVECGTGLGTVSGLVVGGMLLVTKPGAPDLDEVKRLIVGPELKVVIGFYGPIKKETVLKSSDIPRINEIGEETLRNILRDPLPENFMRECWEFVRKTGLASSRVIKGVEAARKAGALGASQAMIGETVYALVEDGRVAEVAEAVKKTGAEVFVTEVEWRPAHLI